MPSIDLIPIHFCPSIATSEEEQQLRHLARLLAPRLEDHADDFSLALTELAHNRRAQRAVAAFDFNTSRPIWIRHGACLPGPAQAFRCAAELLESGFAIDVMPYELSDGLGLAFSHESTLDLEDTAPWTMSLLDIVGRHQGLYWGWDALHLMRLVDDDNHANNLLVICKDLHAAAV